jgi:hypothetical protein
MTARNSTMDMYPTAPFVYSDNTTVSLNPNQNVTFVSVRYIYRWR